MNIAICDDIKSQANLLKNLINAYYQNATNINVKVYNSGDKLETEMEKGLISFDFVFLDILMPGLNGLDIAKTIRTYNPSIPIIFVTSSYDYAIEGYEVDAFSYITKPINSLKIKKVMEKIEKRYSIINSPVLTVRSDGVYYRIPLSTITSIEKMSRKTIIHRLSEQSIETNEPIKNLEHMLHSQPNFIKSYQKNYVNLSHAVSINKSDRVIVLADKKQIFVSRNCINEVLDLYLKLLGE